MTIKYPNVFYFILDASWSSNNSLEFWNKGNTLTSVNNNTVYKTIYDPAPYNFEEPKSSAFNGFSISNVSGSYNKGWNFYCQPNFLGATVFFPAIGIRDIYSGRVNSSTGNSLSFYGATCNYWSCGPTNTYVNAFGLGFNNSAVESSYAYCRAYGFPLRSVLE